MTSAPDGRLVLVRHGESEWNASGRWQGHGGPGLSARGRAEAAITARRLLDEFDDVGVVVRSDLVRVAETAAPLASRCDAPVVVDERLRELDCGAWTGLTGEEIAEAHPQLYAAWCERGDVAPGGGERVADLQVRVVAALRDVLARARGATALVVTHGGPIRVGVAGLLDRSVTRLVDGCPPVGNCALTVLTSTGDTVRLDRYGDRTHLAGASASAAEGPL